MTGPTQLLRDGRVKFGGVLAAGLLAGAALTSQPAATTATNGQRIAALETAVAQLQTRVFALEARLVSPSPGPAPTPTRAPTIAPTAPPVQTLQPPPTATPTSAPTPAAGPAFAEECSGPGLNPKWTSLTVVGDPGFGLDSDFLGNLSQVSVANGLCTITAQRKATPSGRAFASAAIGTRTTFSQRYGTFEARIKYPAGQGVWPAFWTLEAGKLVTPPEVDIFEAYPAPGGPGCGSGTNALITSLHWGGTPHYFVVDRGVNWTAAFHVHKMVWSPGLLVFYVDGVESGRITTNVPAVAMYPIVNLALGSGCYRTDATTPATLAMDIDYVRVWAP